MSVNKFECLECKKEFKLSLGQIKQGRGKYCSKSCAAKHRHRNKEFGFKKGIIPSTAWVKGQKAWNKDKHIKFNNALEKWRKNGGIPWNKGQNFMQDDKHPNWKGDKVGYRALHHWVVRHLGKAKHCSKNLNHVSTLYVWANISGGYKREFSDWRQLCQSCNLTDGIKIPQRFIEGRIALRA